MYHKLKLLILFPREIPSITKPNYNYLFRLGLCYITSILKNNKYNVDCLNLNHCNGTLESILNNQLDNKRYDFILLTGEAVSYWAVKKTIDLVKSHKSKPKSILGGNIITAEPQHIYSLIKPDIGVIGEGEETIIDLLNTIEKLKDLSKVNGIIYTSDQGKIIMTQARRQVTDLDSLPLPELDDFGFNEYQENKYPNINYLYCFFDNPRLYPILGSRGCPLHCTFCYHYTKYRKRSINNIINELKERIKKYKINLVFFYDECMSINKKRLIEFCNEFIKLKKDIPWEVKWIPQLTVHTINDQILTILKRSGVCAISYGFESFSQTVLKSMQKPITPKMIDNAFKKTLEYKIAVQANFIFGDRAETMKTASETIKWWKENAKGQVLLTFIKPYPGSEIYKYGLTKGIFKNDPDFYLKLAGNQWYNLTEKMTNIETKNLKRKLLGLISKYRKFAKKYQIKKTSHNIYQVTVKCPFCGANHTYKNCLVLSRLLYGFNLTCRTCAYRYFVVSPIQRIGYRAYA